MLLRLAGVPTQEERAEQEAMSALRLLLDNLKATRVFCDHDRRDAWIKEVPERGILPISGEPAEKILAAMVRFGGGSLDGAMELLVQHPRYRRSEDEPSGLGFDLSAVDKLEKRWVAAYRGRA